MRRMPIPVRHKPFLRRGCPLRIYAGLARVSPGCPPGRGRLHTCYSPVRRSPAGKAEAFPPLPLDLHVLSLPLAFILSQDQTLRCYILSFLKTSFLVLSVRPPLVKGPGIDCRGSLEAPALSIVLFKRCSRWISYVEDSIACPVASFHCSR